MDFARGEVGGSIQRYEIVAVEISESFEHLAPLEATEDRAKGSPQACGIDRVENGPHLGVGGNSVDSLDRAEVVVRVAAAVVEGQQRGVFEREHSQGRHQGIAKGYFNLAGSRVRKGREMAAQHAEKSVGGTILACFTGGKCHGEPVHGPGW